MWGSWLCNALGEAVGVLTRPVYTTQVGTSDVELVDAANNPIGQSAGNPLFVTGASVIGGAVTIADGADVAEGAKADAAATDSTSAWTVVALLKGLYARLAAGIGVTGSVTANAGTNLNTSALALESGGHLASLDTKLPSQGQALAAASLPVVLTAAQQTALTPAVYDCNSGSVGAATPRIVQGAAPVCGENEISVLVTSTLILAANAKRIRVIIQMDAPTAAYPVYVAASGSAAAVASAGSVLPAVLGWPMVVRSNLAIYGIAVGGTQIVRYREEASA